VGPERTHARLDGFFELALAEVQPDQARGRTG
jgi:hypothetical protein